MSTPTGKELTASWFARVWNQQDEAAIHGLMDPDCEVAGLDLSENGPAGFIPFWQTFGRAFHDIAIEIIGIVEEDGEVAGHARFAASHPATGKEIDVIFSFAATWRDGKLVYARNVFDFSAVLMQTDLLDPEVIGRLLA